MTKIALSTDHAGFNQLKIIKHALELLGYQCIDFGPNKFDSSDDYPDFIKPAASAVADKSCDLGIILGGSGQGEAMAANRFNGVRCIVWYGPCLALKPVDIEGNLSTDPYEILKLAKKHNNSNMLSIGARFVNDEEILKTIKIWLETEFSGEPRHQRRIEKLDQKL